MVYKRVFITQNLAPAISFLMTRQRSDILIRNYLEINAKVPFVESCNVNDSTKDSRLTTARALSSPRPSVLGRAFKSGAITIELDGIKSRNFIHKCGVSIQYVRTRTTTPVLLVHEFFAIVKN